MNKTLSLPVARIGLSAAQLSIAASVTFLVLLAALHIIKPELDPAWRVISEYEIGDYGWMMQLAFFLLALSCIALVPAIQSEVTGFWGKFGLGLLLLSAAGMVIAGIFTSDSMTGSRTPTGQVHELAALLDSIPFAAVLINLTLLRRNPAWSPARRALLSTAFLPLLGLVIFIGSVAVMFPSDGKFGPQVLIGWPNRFFIATHAIWLITVAWQSLRLRVQTA